MTRHAQKTENLTETLRKKTSTKRNRNVQLVELRPRLQTQLSGVYSLVPQSRGSMRRMGRKWKKCTKWPRGRRSWLCGWQHSVGERETWLEVRARSSSWVPGPSTKGTDYARDQQCFLAGEPSQTANSRFSRRPRLRGPRQRVTEHDSQCSPVAATHMHKRRAFFKTQVKLLRVKKK